MNPSSAEITGTNATRTRATALRFVVLIGVVSLFADMAYEGARSITGPYLAVLGASATVVGVVAGVGELLGYSLRLVSGRLSDRLRAYWPIAIVGYVVQMVAVPALALAGSWQVAAGLIIAERIGKAMRNPPRDAMLAHASTSIGRGWAFGLHEALDQTGALVGPLVVAVVLARTGQYPAAFAILVIPAALTLTTLAFARRTYPAPPGVAARPSDLRSEGLPRAFWLYLVAAALVAAGFADFSLIAYNFERTRLVDPTLVPVFYSGAMAAGGVASLVFGRLYDRVGIGLLVPLTAIGALFAPLAFLGSAPVALLGVCCGAPRWASTSRSWPRPSPRWLRRIARRPPMDCSRWVSAWPGLPGARRSGSSTTDPWTLQWSSPWLCSSRRCRSSSSSLAGTANEGAHDRRA